MWEYLVSVDSLYPLGAALLGNFREGQVLYLLARGQHSLGRRNAVFFWNYRWNCKVLLRELPGGPWAQGEPVECPPGTATWSRFHRNWGMPGVLVLLPALHRNRSSGFNSSPSVLLLVLPARILLFLPFLGWGWGRGGSAPSPPSEGLSIPTTNICALQTGQNNPSSSFRARGRPLRSHSSSTQSHPALPFRRNQIFFFLFVPPLVPFIPRCNSNPTTESLWLPSVSELGLVRFSLGTRKLLF